MRHDRGILSADGRCRVPDSRAAKGRIRPSRQVVDLGAISDTAILCIEGERDDISGIGQTRAALNVTPGLPDAMKKYHFAPEVGHYGIFNGTRWRNAIAPVVDAWIAQFDGMGNWRRLRNSDYLFL